jgi:Tol biopolymer transport system component
MNQKTRNLGLVILIALFAGYCTPQNKAPVLEGPYFGQEPPGMTAEVFAPGIVSTGHGEFCSVFSPDGTEFYWSLTGAPYPTIVVIHQDGGRWTEPEIAPFSGKCYDVDMAFTPDGKQLFFCSRRPLDGAGPPINHVDIWFVERDGGRWSEPRHLEGPVNSSALEYYPIFASNGTLYFSSTRPGGLGSGDIYRARFKDGMYQEPENLGPTINTVNFEGDLFIAPDESYIIVTCYDRSDSFGSGDLYISFRQGDGSWSTMKNMGDSINSAANEHCPMLSPDGKYLFFSSGRSRHPDYSNKAITFHEKIEMMNSWGNGRNEDIYWIDSKIIEELRPQQ